MPEPMSGDIGSVGWIEAILATAIAVTTYFGNLLMKAIEKRQEQQEHRARLAVDQIIEQIKKTAALEAEVGALKERLGEIARKD